MKDFLDILFTSEVHFLGGLFFAEKHPPRARIRLLQLLNDRMSLESSHKTADRISPMVDCSDALQQNDLQGAPFSVFCCIRGALRLVVPVNCMLCAILQQTFFSFLLLK